MSDTEKIIPIPEASEISRQGDITEINNLRARIIDLEKRAKNIDFTIDITKVIVIGVIVVFFLAFLGLAIDAWRFHAQSYNEYKSTLESVRIQLQATQEKVANLRRR